MRTVIQRVSYSKVDIDGKTVAEIEKGLNVLVGFDQTDTEADLKYLAEKILNLRIFEDDNNKMNLSCLDIKGEVLVISQFTLYGDCRKGRRPDFTSAAKAEDAQNLYNKFIDILKKSPLKIESGQFQAMMDVVIHNWGPVTILLDSKKCYN